MKKGGWYDVERAGDYFKQVKRLTETQICVSAGRTSGNGFNDSFKYQSFNSAEELEDWFSKATK